ncbi:tRNA (adenosine(37)-N6)-threonylcarbamoyltransferase complex transferase subunit TsaD [bacterium]|nr:tRNA (adenosine(37)-N6)-threonylcarbamoyltransferase complex transferase subunit TsaD [bacterium]
MKIFAIESSCDESAIALLEIEKGKIKILKNIISSQINIHQQYGGIVPEVAARAHCENFFPILKESKINIKNVDYIAVTYGPGLITSLMIGVELAKTLSYVYKKPLIPINHIEAHIYSNWLSHPELFSKKTFPALAVVVSGGHTNIFLMKNYGKYQLIGNTVDDAVGEAYDKVAKILNLGYPGGPIISKKAERYQGLDLSSHLKKGDKDDLNFPRPMMHTKNFDMSFSGLKTAVLYKAQAEKKWTEQKINQYCFSFQNAVVDVLTHKIIKAAQKYKVKNILLGGGVSANQELRNILKIKADQLGIKTYFPELKHTGDNAAMIAITGYFNRANAKKNNFSLMADANLKL